MKIGGKKIILVIVLLAFSFLCGVFAEEPASVKTDDFSTPEKAFIAMQTAVQNGDYAKAWQMSAESIKQKFDGNFEEFKKCFSDQTMRTSIISSKVEAVNLLTPKEAEIRISVSFIVSNYMVLEDGGWKFAGKIEEVK